VSNDINTPVDSKDVSTLPVESDVTKKTAAKKHKEYPPEKVLFDYRVGTEKTILDSVKSRVFNVASTLKLGKDGVSFRIEKVSKHPVFQDGYVFELQKDGDGGSYLTKVIEAFRDTKCRHVWIEMSKGHWASVEQRSGHIETAWTDMEPDVIEEGDVVIPFDDNKPRTMKPLYRQSYAFFYVSLMLLFCSTLSVTAAALFKYVWYDKTTDFVNKQYYTADKYMPIPALREQRRNDGQIIVAIKYSPVKKWHFLLERRDDEGVKRYEQLINPDGSLAQLVETSSTEKGEDNAAK
jgi:hypothetical protein